MDGRSSTLFLALALVAAGLAGCIQNPDWLNSADVEVSAREHRALADAAAASWHEGAALLGVLAIETRESIDPRLALDPEVGNGRAPAWWYVYAAPQSASMNATPSAASRDAGGETTTYAAEAPNVRAFKVTSDGAVSSEEDAAALAAGYGGHEMAEVLGEWTLDSDAALAVAKGDDGFRGAAEGVNATLLAGLARHEGRASWWFGAASAGGFVLATVDAVTGELVEVKPLDVRAMAPTFEMAARPPVEWIPEPVVLEGEGVAAPGAMAAEFPFATRGAMSGPIVLEYMGQFPIDGLHWSVMDAEGKAVAYDHVTAWRGGGVHEGEIELEKAGDYVLRIEYMAGVPLFGPVPTPGSVTYTFLVELMPGLAVDADEEEGTR